MAIYNLRVDQMIVFQQPNTDSTEKGGFASDTIHFIETIRCSKMFLRAENNIYFGQTTKIDTTVKNLTVNQTFYTWHRAIKGPSVQVVQILAMWDSSLRVLWESVKQTLTFHHSTNPGKGKGTRNFLLLNQQALYNVERFLMLNQTLDLVSAVNVYEPDFCKTIGNYPFGGPNSSPSEVF